MRIGESARLINVQPNRCWRKQRWASKGAADAHLRALLRNPNVYGEKELASYACPLCKGYHVGHDRFKKERDARRQP